MKPGNKQRQAFSTNVHTSRLHGPTNSQRLVQLRRRSGLVRLCRPTDPIADPEGHDSMECPPSHPQQYFPSHPFATTFITASDQAEMSPRYRRDVAEISPRCGRDIAETRPRSRRASALGPL